MSKGKSGVSKLKFQKKTVRRIDAEELKKAGGGLRDLTDGDICDGGYTEANCSCPTRFFCCQGPNHNQALRRRAA